ncbi:ABC transporter ATP-binding protein [Desulfosarcina widdelii]|uniref:ABC transporter ATP-binding protein n=1 Tax=Desulfosarcina widdelii TaxID=947919 RepID=A0A5K7Z0S3_9BACT|nr:ATP-binding cassette domain-containing protein [Desulfosarcina widdelii]BBO75286.1 ABC transporter ATP-binding protein [Desulfosarcina widdelii]
MIRLQNLRCTFHAGTPNAKTVIRDLDLTVQAGEFVTIIGSNGAGKTTLFNLISGSLMPTAGKVYIGDEDVTAHPEHKRARYLGRIFQDPLVGTASNMTLEDNMMITCKKGFKWPVISLNRKMRAYFCEQLIHLKMGLESRMKENVSSLSGGQRQALTLLMMVLSRPDIALLDEHTAALDPRNAAIVMDLTTRFIREHRLTTLMITHNMNHAITYGSRLLMMDAGEIIIDVSGEEKKKLTVPRLLGMFADIRRQEFENDEVLLAGGRKTEG